MIKYLIVFLVYSHSYALGLKVTGGRTSLKGDLSSERSANFYNLQIQNLISKNDHFVSFFGIDVLKTQAKQAMGGSFPFLDNEELDILSFLFSINICPTFTNKKFLNCVSIGQGTVNVNCASDKRDYGSWAYHTSSDYFFLKNQAIGLSVKYVGKVEQEVTGKASEFSFYNFGLSYTYRY